MSKPSENHSFLGFLTADEGESFTDVLRTMSMKKISPPRSLKTDEKCKKELTSPGTSKKSMKGIWYLVPVRGKNRNRRVAR